MREKIVRRKLADGTVKEYRYRRRSTRILTGSLGALIQEYRQSPEFLSLSESTRKNYLRAMGYMEDMYRVAITDIKRRHIIKYRNSMSDRPAAANKLVATFSVLMQYAVDMEYRETNPAHRIKLLPGGEFRRWNDAEIAFALEHFPTTFQRALILALYTGQREGDVLAMRWSDYDGEAINVVQEKTGTKLWIPCHQLLRDELEAWKAERTATTIVTDTRGRPYRVPSFASMFSVRIRKHPELHGLVFHGLRKTAAAKLAEAGCTTHEIASITGHKTLSMLQHYTLEAEQKTRAKAAVIKLENVARKVDDDEKDTNAI